MEEAYLYKKLKDDKTQCQNCAHYCVLSKGEKGLCGVRKNKEGKIFALNYGLLCALNVDPIEKKPFFHFLPGSYSLSLASVGCNFQCKSCQNWRISQGPTIFDKVKGEKVSPEGIIETALNNKIPSISYTYTEPAIFSEFALDTMKLAKKAGLKNLWVTNGFWSKELFNLIHPYLDAVNVDLKSFENDFYNDYCNGSVKPILENLKKIKEKNIWLEITTLVIPCLNDSEKNLEDIARFIKKQLGEETPWHLSKFSGAISWQLQKTPSTPMKTLEKAFQIGKQKLKYVYLGNVSNKENTFCPKCDSLMVKRENYKIERFDKNSRCSNCNENLNLKS